jgi:adenylate kinase family enzyme
MPRIIIIGNGGTGKSTLGEHLARELAIPVTHLDQLSLRPGWQYVPEDEFTAKLRDILEARTWIVEGWSYHSTMQMRIKAANVIIHLDYPIWYCYWNAAKRHIRYTFKQNPYDPPNSPIWKKTRIMVKAMWRVHKLHEPEARRWLKEAKHANVLTFYSRRELKRSLRLWRGHHFVELNKMV